MFHQHDLSIQPDTNYAPDLTTHIQSFGHSHPLDDGIRAMTSSSSARVFTPDEPIVGYSQSALGDAWWQYIETIPYAQHFGAFDDTTDTRGKLGSVEKALFNQPLVSNSAQDSVLLIGGAFGDLPQGVTGIYTINRTIILPEGTHTVFFPILNGNSANLTTDSKNIDVNNPFITGGRNSDQLKLAAAYLMNLPSVNPDGNGTSELFATIDGQIVINPYQYRQATEGNQGFYSYPIPGGMTEAYFLYPADASYLANPALKGTGTITPDNPDGYPTIAELGGYGNFELGPIFADGYWLGVELAPGEHTLNFGGTFSMVGEDGVLAPAFALNITYHILNQVSGTACKDYLSGTGGSDYINGDKGNDVLHGLAGDDLILGGLGADVMDGGIGNDELWGDGGNDTFIFKSAYGQDLIYDFEAGDRVTVDVQGLCNLTATNETLTNGLSAAKFNFGNGDTLTLVGINASQLKFENGVITVAA